MKKITLLFIVPFFVCFLQACHSNKSSGADSDDDTTTEAIDTTKKVTIVVDKADIKFVTDIGAACMTEIKIGTLAKLKGTDKRVKNFGAMMVKDLTKGKGRLVALAKAKKITLPDSVTDTQEKEIAALAAKTGKDFDHAYLDKTRDDYKKALEQFENTSKYGFDPDIKNFATKNLLTLQRHLDAIDAIHGSLK
jgi:putative membrane protein